MSAAEFKYKVLKIMILMPESWSTMNIYLSHSCNYEPKDIPYLTESRIG